MHDVFKSARQNLFCALKSATYHCLTSALEYPLMFQQTMAVQGVTQEPETFIFTLLDHLIYYIYVTFTRSQHPRSGKVG